MIGSVQCYHAHTANPRKRVVEFIGNDTGVLDVIESIGYAGEGFERFGVDAFVRRFLDGGHD